MKILTSIALWHRVYKYSKSDQGEFAYIKKSIHQGDLVFDIGAHKAGYLYYMLQQAGKEGKVVGFGTISEIKESKDKTIQEFFRLR